MGKPTSTHCPCLRYLLQQTGIKPYSRKPQFFITICVPHSFSTSFFPQAGYQLYAVSSLLVGITIYLYLQEHIVLPCVLVNTEKSTFRIWELPAVIAYCSCGRLTDGTECGVPRTASIKQSLTLPMDNTGSHSYICVNT